MMTLIVSVMLARNPGSVDGAIIDDERPGAAETDGESNGLLEVTDDKEV